jgi:hypothetical protein
MPCGVCNAEGHNIKTCVYNARRVPAAPNVKKSSRCQCCGQYGYAIHRHHTKGRGNPNHFLDVCGDCHKDCCHKGDFYWIGIKPRVCQIMNRDSYWRG